MNLPSGDVQSINQQTQDYLPGYMGVRITATEDKRIEAELDICPHHLAPNGFLHAGTVITLADSAAGYGCMAHLPESATSFTTIELKSNFLGTARKGVIRCVATAVHLGRTTQVWDSVVTDAISGKTIALFRCTQMVIFPKSQTIAQ